jgi:hypothetical protein
MNALMGSIGGSAIKLGAAITDALAVSPPVLANVDQNVSADSRPG